MGESKISRRRWLEITGGTIAGLAVGAAAGYYSGTALAPPAAIVTKEVTKTVPGPTVTVTPAAPIPVVGATVMERAINAAKEVVKRDNIPAGTTLTIMCAEPIAPAHEDTKELWERETGTKIKVAGVPGAEVYEKVMTEMVTKTGIYDVFHLEPYMTGDFVPGGLLKDVTDWARKYDARIHGPPDGFAYPYDWQLSYFEGRVYGFPTDGDTLFAFYRKDLFEDPKEKEKFEKQYGYPLKYPETLEEYRDTCEFFYRPPDLYGCGEFRMYWGYPNYFWRMACKKWPVMYPFDDDMNALLDTPEGIKAAEEYVEVTKFGHKDILTLDVGESYDLFAKGKVACSVNYPSHGKYIHDPAVSKVVGKVTVAMPPGTVVDSPVGKKLLRKSVNGGGWLMTTSNYSKYPELAYLYCQYFASPEIIVEASIGPGSWLDPIRYNQMGEFADPRQAKTHGPETLIYAEVTEQCVPMPPLKGLHEYIIKFNKNIADACLGVLTPAAAMEKTAKEWNETTDRLGRDAQKRSWASIKPWYPIG